MKIKGELALPGDKSISHRAALFSSLYKGKTHFDNFPSSADCLATLDCLHRLSVNWTLEHDRLILQGNGKFAYNQPEKMLDAKNSGTTIRLLSGILTAQRFSCSIAGDKHLNRRPMARILLPLRMMGARIEAGEGNVPPLLFRPVTALRGIEYNLPLPSAQVKSCVLLAGLYAEGETVVIEKKPSRDHTERMLGLKVIESENRQRKIYSNPDVEIRDLSMHIPGDLSSAVFFLVAALLLPGSEIWIKNVSLNPSRTGILEVFQNMGAKVEIQLKQSIPEPMGDIYVIHQKLKNIHLQGDIIPSIIDEIPVLSILASQSDGEFLVRNASELRVKESDRIHFICQNLRNLGIELEEFDDGFAFQGPQLIKGGKVITGDDHRIAMAFAIAGLVAKSNIVLDNPGCVDVSFPGFWQKVTELGEKG